MFNLGHQPADKTKPFQSQPDQTFPNQPAFNQAQNQPLNNQLTSPKGLFQIPEKYLQLIPLLPFALEILTGQKVPPVGVMADILSEVKQVQFNVSQLLANQNKLIAGQQQLWTKLESLESNASNKPTSN